MNLLSGGEVVDHSTRLTSTEIGNIWTSYITENAISVVLSHFLKHTEDPDIHSLLSWTLENSQNNISILKRLFAEEKYPLPIAFSEKDLDISATKLYDDIYYLFYLKYLAKLGLGGDGMALSVCSRKDIRQYYKNSIQISTDLFDKAQDLMLIKGVHDRPPFIYPPEKADFVKKQSFMDGFFGGKKRPLTAIEISHMYSIITSNIVGKVLVTGFSQVTRDKDVADYMVKGKLLAQKQIDVMREIMEKEDLPVPMTRDTDVTDSKDFTFSDNLMMFLVSNLTANSIGEYGMALGTAARKDLGLTYSRLAAEILQYGAEGANLLIEKGWMEEPPQAINRSELKNH